MVFRNILNDKTAFLRPEFDQLFQDALINQTHPGDLLLVSENGFYNKEVHTWNNLDKKFSPYAIGPGHEGHSERLHNDFIGTYLNRNIREDAYTDYVNRVNLTPERSSEINALVIEEAYSIQQEMLIYQKIWEMDSFIKKFYQLARIVNREDYDWHFKIRQSTHKEDKGHKREHIIRILVRDKLKTHYPKIYTAIKTAYKTQVRNSIAHSKYSIFDRFIHLNNLIEGDENSSMQVVTFDDWAEMIHNTIVLYTQLNILLNSADKLYLKMANKKNQTMEIRINRKDPVVAVEFQLLKPRTGFGGWFWSANDQADQ
jgi:hypothetical protein